MEKTPPPPVRLPIFIPNEIKTFRFTIDQYVQLEMEYNRYMIYKETVKNIENVFKVAGLCNDTSNRRNYESKSIFDRFVLECINHGISPHCNVQTSKTISTPHMQSMQSIQSMQSMQQKHRTPHNLDEGMQPAFGSLHLGSVEVISSIIDTPILANHLFFNVILADENKIKETVYFKKMISEYIEKRFKFVNDKVPSILKVLSLAHFKYARIVNDLLKNKTKPNVFADISCCIMVSPNSENYIIRYKTFSKVINFQRYIKLIKNYSRPFPFDILRMILRYAIFEGSNQQWSIGITLYDIIASDLEIGLEMFASPLNFNMNQFCSLFLDTDKTFGSIGSFYNLSMDKILNINMRGVFYNPPYLPILMATTSRMCLQFLEEMATIGNDYYIVSFLPNWADADYIKNFIMSPYCVYQKMIPKGEYVLHEKDKGKLIRGTFELLFIVMNSIKNKWSVERSSSFDKWCKNIVKIMKDETQIQNIEK